MGGYGGLTDQERTDLEAEFGRLDSEIEDLKDAGESLENRKQISEKSARLREISVIVIGGGAVQNQQIKRSVASSFHPYHCGVEFIPVDGSEGLGLRVSNEDDSLTYEAQATLKALRTDFKQHVAMWREGAIAKGFALA